jgi:hypothetical protein
MSEVCFSINNMRNKYKNETGRNLDIELVCGGAGCDHSPKNTKYYMGVWIDVNNNKHVEQLNWVKINVENC